VTEIPESALFGALAPLPRGPHRLSAEVVAASQRSRLLAAITALVAERGYAGTTITDLARRAGVSPNVFYEHFSDKEECYLAAYDVFVELLVRAITEAAGPPEEPWESFVGEAVGAYLGVMEDERTAARAFVLEVEGAGPIPRRHLRRALHGFALLVRERHFRLRAEESTLGPLPDRAYLGLVHGIRALVGEALQDDTRMADLLPDVQLWVTATLQGAASAAHLREAELS